MVTSDWRVELGHFLKPFLDRLGHKARRPHNRRKTGHSLAFVPVADECSPLALIARPLGWWSKRSSSIYLKRLHDARVHIESLSLRGLDSC